MRWREFTGTALVFVMIISAGCGFPGVKTTDRGGLNPNAGQSDKGQKNPQQADSKVLQYVSEINLLGKGLQLNSLDYSQEGNIFVSPDGRLAALSASGFTKGQAGEHESKLIVADLISGRVRVMDTGTLINVLQWSPDSSRLLYRKFESLMTVDVNGGKPVEISSRSFYGSFSPDGTKVAYAEPGKGLSLTGVNGGGARRLTDKSGDWYPVWYPDGKNIFYFADRGIKLGDGAGQLLGFGKVNIDTGKTQVLIPGETGKYRRAAWVAKDVLLINKGWDDGNFEIIANLAANKVTELGENYMNSDYSVAADRSAGVVIKAEKNKISTIDGNGRAVSSFPYKKPGGDSNRMNYGYTVSPDGRTLAFLFGAQGYSPDSSVKGRQIWVCEVKSGNSRMITLDGDFHQPAWTPDGKHLVAVETDGGKGGRFAIHILEAVYSRPARENVEVTLYFGDDQAMYLKPEQRIVDITGKQLAEVLVQELIKGPQKNGLHRTIPGETRLISVEMNDGVAYVNFSKEIRTKHWGGSSGEAMTVQSIVQTLTRLPEIKKVQFLIEGQKEYAIWGHGITDKPIGPAADIVAK